MTANPPQEATRELRDVGIGSITVSPRQPRRTFDEGKLRELTESVRALGILQPILVRPRGKGQHELVWGERRLRAAQRANLVTIPAFVRDMTDLEVLEEQVVENAQREEVHPLEEADAFQRLVEEYKKTVKEVAARIGKSETHVYQRLKLCSLGTAARAFFLSGKMSAAVANLVARIPDPKLQAQAAKDVCQGRYDGQPLALQQALEHIRDKYMLRLDQAPFDTASELLVAGCGSCTACPKRTGNQRELFADVKSPDLCTDPPCYEKKAAAGWKVTAAEAKDRGIKVLSEAELKKLYPFPGNPSMERGEYVDLSDNCHEDPKGRTYQALLGKAPDGYVVARDPLGRPHKLLPRAGLKAALKDAGHDFWKKQKQESPAMSAKERAQRENDRAESQSKEAVSDEIVKDIVAKLERNEPSAGQWQALIGEVLELCGTDGRLLHRRGLETKDEHVGFADAKKLVANKSKGWSAAQLRALFIEAAILDSVADGYRTEGIERVGRAFGVDVKAVRKRVIADRFAQAKLDAEQKKTVAAAPEKKPSKKPGKKKR